MGQQLYQGNRKLSIYRTAETIDQPSWKQIVEELEKLNGETKSQLSIELEGVGSLLVAGGGKPTTFFDIHSPEQRWNHEERLDQSQHIYCVTFFEPHKDWHQLVQIQSKFHPDECTFLDLDLSQEVRAAYCVYKDQVLEVLSVFFETGELSSQFTWIHEG